MAIINYLFDFVKLIDEGGIIANAKEIVFDQEAGFTYQVKH